MLVLTRKENEDIEVGAYKIHVVKIRGKSVRIGIIAPREVPVHRGEVAAQIKSGGKDKKRVA